MRAPETDSFVLGLVFPSSVEGIECAQGATIAVDMARQDGGIVPSAVLSAIADAPAEVTLAAKRLASNGARILVGTLYTALAAALSREAAELGVVHWEVAAVADDLAGRGQPFFRTAPRADSFGETATELLRATVGPDGSAVACVAEDSPFGRSLGDAVRRHAATAGFPVVTDLLAAPDGIDLDSVLAALLAARPRAIFAACYTDLARMLWSRLRGSDLSLPMMVGVGGGWLHLEHDDAPGEGEQVYVIDSASTTSIDSSGLALSTRMIRSRYLDLFSRQFGQTQTVYADLGFVGADLLLREALPRTRSLEPDAMRLALDEIDLPGGSTLLGFGARFDKLGNNVRARPVVSQWQGGRLLTVYPPELATAKPDLRPALGHHRRSPDESTPAE